MDHIFNEDLDRILDHPESAELSETPKGLWILKYEDAGSQYTYQATLDPKQDFMIVELKRTSKEGNVYIKKTEYEITSEGFRYPVKGYRSFGGKNDMTMNITEFELNAAQSDYTLEFPKGTHVRDYTRRADPPETYRSGETKKSYEQIVRGDGKFVAGVAIDEAGSPVTDVLVQVCCHKKTRADGRFSFTFSYSFDILNAVTDEQGRFAIELQEDGQYNLRFSPENHAAMIAYDVPVGKSDLKVTLSEGGTVIGRLLRNEDGKQVPIASAEVKIEQNSRSGYSHLGFDRDQKTVTDSQGRFRFDHLRTKMRDYRTSKSEQWEYSPRVWEISYDTTSKTIAFYEGTKIEDMELVVEPDYSNPASLVGKPLPDFESITIEFEPRQARDKMLLVCFWDMNQRPSRNCIMQLAKNAEELKEKGVATVIIQSSKVDENELEDWMKKNGTSFPNGMIQGDESKTRFTWGIKSLPWLIQTDREHIVRAEGFGLDELGEKLSETAGIAYGNARAASEPTNRQIRVIGVARNRDGKPVAGVEVQRLHGPGPVSTDAAGKFELIWDPERNRPLVDTYYIIARHERENLSAVVEVPEFEQGTETVNLNLLPGVIFKGKVVDPAGRAIDSARVGILLHTPTQGSGLYHTITDSEGMFEFRGIPTDHKYSFAAQASGHGTKWVHDIYAGHDFARKDFKLEPMTLAIADQSVSGMVVDANDKPISDARLSTDGQGQPQHYNVRTDAEGKFTIDEVCAGSLRIFATVHGETMLRGYALTYGGATDVHIVMKEVSSPDRRGFVRRTPPSLVGRALPELKDLGIELSTSEAGSKQMLLCFFDLEQRPSRYFVGRLAKQAGQLKNKGVVIVVAQASKVDENRLNEWIKENNIPFPIGMPRGDATKTRFTWGIKSLPWLILTDREHVVIAEGFGLAELDAKIEEIGPPASTAVDSNKVVGLVKDPQGRPLSGVRVTEFRTDKDYTTDADGRFISAFGPSDERRFFFVVDKQRELVGVGRLPSGERHVEIKLTPGKIVSGTVVDPAGKPVAGAQVAPLPMTCFNVLTDKEGQFDVAWSPSWEPGEGLCLMVRHVGLNLAALADITEYTQTIEVKLTGALTLTGTVEDPNGKPIPGAKTSISLIRGWGCGTPVNDAITNDQGRFELYCLPQRQEYGVRARAEGFWRNQITTGIINRTIDREEVGPVILKRPVLSVSGVVLHGNNKVVAGIPVYLWGEGQPDLDSKTDTDGKFVFEKVCCGPVRISAKNDTLFGKIETGGGAKNVKLVVRPRFE